MRNIEFENRKLKIDGQNFELDYQIKDARIINDLAVVIFEFDDSVPKYRQFHNCCGFDINGNLIWTAEHPTSTTSDFYVEFINSKSNKLWNFACYVCKLDFKTGKLIKANFTK